MTDLTLQYPTWYIFLCVALGALYAIALYFRDKKFGEQKAWLPVIMSFLRGTTVTGIALLLLAPLLKSVKEDTRKPMLIIAEDVSESIPDQGLSILDNAATSLNDKYDVKRVYFGSGTRIEMDSNLIKSSNISGVIRFFNDQYQDQKVAGILLGSDGIYNEGADPRYTPLLVKAPLYTVAVGDTTKRKDVYIKNLFHNKIAYLGDKVAVQVDLQAYNALGSDLTVSISKIGSGGIQKLDQNKVKVDRETYFQTVDFVVDANEVGNIRYRVSVSTIANEINTTNNNKDIYLEVIDQRQKILVLGNAPHPDLGAIEQLLSNNQNYEVDIEYAGEGAINYGDYNLVLLHNLPSQKHAIQTTLGQLDRLKIPRLFIVGLQTDITAFNNQQELVSIVGDGRSLENIQVQVNQAFTGYTLNMDLLNNLTAYPPLDAPFGDYKTKTTASTVMNQRIKKIETAYPLLTFTEQNGYRSGVWVGEGLWRWRLFNYMKDQNYEVISEVVEKAIQYLSLKEDKRKFRAAVAKNRYRENESILFDAQLYNDSYEKINLPDAFLKITNDEGKEYAYTFSRSSDYYVLDAGLFPPGNYRFVASTNFEGKTLEDRGQFSVEDVQLEQYDLTARHDILNTLANQTGGAMYTASNFNELVADLTEAEVKPVIYQSTTTRSVLNLRWLFGVLLTLLGLEWFLRRYFGYY